MPYSTCTLEQNYLFTSSAGTMEDLRPSNSSQETSKHSFPWTFLYFIIPAIGHFTGIYDRRNFQPITKQSYISWYPKFKNSRTSCNGKWIPKSEEFERKLANRRKSLSAILGRMYSSGPTKKEKKNHDSLTNSRIDKTNIFMELANTLDALQSRNLEKLPSKSSHIPSPHWK